MAISTLTDKGQTTVPEEIREGLKIEFGQQLDWSLQADGTAVVRPRRSALGLFGSLKSSKKYAGRKAEREAVNQNIGRLHAKKGID
jgi:bifunctional DNA-binding transcriptional regulator/antitoxin component of YhaV-PrlF toxin-antitoxin module